MDRRPFLQRSVCGRADEGCPMPGNPTSGCGWADAGMDAEVPFSRWDLAPRTEARGLVAGETFAPDR